MVVESQKRMNGTNEERTLEAGDGGFRGVNGHESAENLEAGVCAGAVNMDFTSGDARTRGSFVCLPALGAASFNVSTGWTSRTSAADKPWFGMAYGNGRFVAVSQGAGTSDIMYSVDGFTWTSVTSGFSKQWWAVTYGNGLFVAVSTATGGVTNTVMYSVDGVTWTGVNSAAARTWKAVVYGAGLFVACCNDGTTQQVMTSPDGATWTIRSTPASQSGNAWDGIAYSDTLGLFAAVSSSGTGNRVMTSPDGITWTARTSAADESWSGIAWGSGRFVAVSHSGGTSACMTSFDGITWTARTTVAPSTFAEWRGVAYGNGLFVAVGAEGVAGKAIMTTSDGITWAGAAAPTSQQWYSVAYGNGTFVAGPQSGVSATVMTKSFYTTPNSSGVVLASGIYSDPDDPGSQWIMMVGASAVGFYAGGKSTRSVPITGYTVSEQSTVVQCNNLVYIFRGSSETPLYWDGDWGGAFTVAPTPSQSAGFSIIPNSNQATFSQNRLWVINGKDSVAASDILDFTTFDDLANDFNLSTGDSDYLVATYPFGTTTLVVFKNKSIHALTGIDGALGDVVATEITRQVGCIGINAIVSVGPDLVYMSDQNINMLSLTSTSNALQHRTLPLSQNITNIFKRVNWAYANKVSMAYFDNKLFVALPLDNSAYCNTVCVYNFITEQWFGEWNFDAAIGMAIQGWVTGVYGGIQRLHCVTESGRIFVLVDGYYDMMGTIQAEIQSSLLTRAYRVDGAMADGGTFIMDISTHKPTYSVTAKSSAQGYTEALVSDQTYSRSQTWKSGDSAYSLTNSGDDYNRPWRKDYAWTVSDNVQCRSGFLPMALQNVRVPLRSRVRGRTISFLFENTTGFATVNGITFSAKPGNRRTTTQTG